MRHGEYIALGKIEAILKTCAAVSNIVVYGSGMFIITNSKVDRLWKELEFITLAF